MYVLLREAMYVTDTSTGHDAKSKFHVYTNDFNACKCTCGYGRNINCWQITRN